MIRLLRNLVLLVAVPYLFIVACGGGIDSSAPEITNPVNDTKALPLPEAIAKLQGNLDTAKKRAEKARKTTFAADKIKALNKAEEKIKSAQRQLDEAKATSNSDSPTAQEDAKEQFETAQKTYNESLTPLKSAEQGSDGESGDENEDQGFSGDQGNDDGGVGPGDAGVGGDVGPEDPGPT